MNRNLLEQVSVLPEHVGFGAFPNDRFGWQYEHIIKLFNGNVDACTLAWAKTPNKEGTPLLPIQTRLVGQRNKEVKRTTVRVDGIRQMANVESLIQLRPTTFFVLGELDLNGTLFLSCLLKIRGLALEGVADNVQHLMIRQIREQLPRLNLLPKFHRQFLHLIGNTLVLSRFVDVSDLLNLLWRCPSCDG